MNNKFISDNVVLVLLVVRLHMSPYDWTISIKHVILRVHLNLVFKPEAGISIVVDYNSSILFYDKKVKGFILYFIEYRITQLLK